MFRKTLLLLLVPLFFTSTFAQVARIQSLLDSLRIAGNYPGLSLSIVKDNQVIALVSGFNDKEANLALKPADRLLQGSVGKTYVSAIALLLVKQGKLDLDRKVSSYLRKYDWYHRLPNAADITVRMLMNHTSGVMRYEFKDQFLKDLTASPGRHWEPHELLAYILDEKASFRAGEGWEYSDSNYILLGMILEAITGRPYSDLLKMEILEPLRLSQTFPSEGRKLNGLAQGYAGVDNEFGGKDRMIGPDGLFIINPQFEWTGGGIYSTTADLARWGKLLYEGKLIDTSLLLSSAVPAKLGRDTKYGLGVIVKPSPIGISYGHSGFFPGYMTEMYYYPAYKMCIALQSNSSDFKNLKISLARCMAAIAKEASLL